jgi:mannose-1-phosphate guanylyltransferase
MSRLKAVLLAGGLGTRLRPVTDALPKCLVPIAGRPLLDYWFDALQDAGIRDVLINTHHLPSQVRCFIEDKNSAGWHVQEAFEPTLLGSAGTIRANSEWCTSADHCLVIYADNLSTVCLSDFLRFHQSHSDPFSMLLFQSANPSACGIATLDEQQRITEFIEKPQHPKSNLANGGVYAWTADAYREIAAMNAFDLGFDVIPRFVGRMRGWEFNGFHLDIGTPENLARANAAAPGLFAARQSG